VSQRNPEGHAKLTVPSCANLTSFAAACDRRLLPIMPVQAQPIRTFIALTGSDANPCTFASPCKSAQHAHDVVATGGEIRM